MGQTPIANVPPPPQPQKCGCPAFDTRASIPDVTAYYFNINLTPPWFSGTSDYPTYAMRYLTEEGVVEKLNDAIGARAHLLNIDRGETLSDETLAVLRAAQVKQVVLFGTDMRYIYPHRVLSIT
jgi:hypothetical protein